jgi:steroid delta-isomerase-like uncharacterized protein
MINAMAMPPRDVVARFLEAYNSAAWGLLDELVTSGYVHHNGEQALDLAQFKQGAAWIRTALPDLTIEMEDTVSEGERLAVRFVGRGTHLGSLAGEPPTGRPVVLHGIFIYRFEHGLIAEDWEAMDEQQLLRQISTDS